MAERGGWRAHSRGIRPVPHGAWLLLPLLFTFLISLDRPLPQKRAISLDRFFNPLLPVSSILVLLGFQKALSSGKAIGSPTLALLRVATGSSMRSLCYSSSHVRDGWREATATINATAQPSDVVLVRPHHYAPPYNELDRLDWPTVPHWRSAEEFDEFLTDEVAPRISDCGSLCTMIVSQNASAHSFVPGSAQGLLESVHRDELGSWLTEHYRLLDEGVYRDVHPASYGRLP